VSIKLWWNDLRVWRLHGAVDTLGNSGTVDLMLLIAIADSGVHCYVDN
jgi:hypothetical protein